MDTIRPLYGERLVSSLIDEKAQSDPSQECFSVPRSNSAHDGWVSITWAQYANSINRVAAMILQDCGLAPAKVFPTIAYIGSNDARYLVFVVAAVKAGYKALLISPRNSEEGQLNLFRLTECSIVYHDTSFASMVASWLKSMPMKAFTVMSLAACFDTEMVLPVPHNAKFWDTRWDPFVVLHTSGSTGLPKPVIVRQGVFSSTDLFHDLPRMQDNYIFLHEYASSSRSFLPLPLFHASGLYGFFGGLFWDLRVALPLPSAMLTAHLALQVLVHANCDSIFLPCSILEELSNNDAAVDVLKSLKFVGFGGGSLAPEAGNKLVKKGVILHNAIGSTEVAAFPYYWQKNMSLWDWHIINSEALGADWQRAEGEENDIYELVILRKDKEPRMQSVFYQMPELNEFRTKDLFKKHPTETNHWRYHGRIDNIITFSNGEKLNPILIEENLTGHPKVKGALVIGNMKFQPALLLELASSPTSETEAAAILDELWPWIAQVNERVPAHGRIVRHLIAIATAEKPFPRLDKDTIRRLATEQLYEKETDELYTSAIQIKPTPDSSFQTHSPEALLKCLIDLPRHIGIGTLDADADLFMSGLDSLKVLEICALLRGVLHNSDQGINPRIISPHSIYSNPTLRKLANYLFATLNNKPNDSDDDQEASVRIMKALLSKSLQGLPTSHVPKPKPNDTNQTIIITGSTGRLGSHLLDNILSTPTVKKVICLNRSTDGRARQLEAMSSQGLRVDLGNVEFLHADLSKAHLGLDPVVYERLSNEVDRIVHCQWAVNFNLSVESFENHIHGVRSLVDFSYGAVKSAPVIFISSILSAIGLDVTGQDEDLRRPTTGYGRSKLIGERILLEATARSGISTAIIRVGQIAGSEKKTRGGIWSRQEWLPSIVSSSVQQLGVLPRDLGAMDKIRWLPIDRVARMVLDVSGIAETVSLANIRGYFYGINPHQVSWTALAEQVADFYGDRVQRLVGWEEWIEALESSSLNGDEGNPALKLLDFFKHDINSVGDVEGQVARLTKIGMERTLRASDTMRETEAISVNLMLKWCLEWGF